MFCYSRVLTSCRRAVDHPSSVASGSAVSSSITSGGLHEFLDHSGNAFLLIRHTGMRIGECVDLSCSCLHSTGPHQWAIHVPLGKLQTERIVPVDSFVCTLIHRLRFFRSLDPLPADGLLFARPGTKDALVRQLRDYLHQVCHSLGLSTGLVPHQLRHSYASEMARSG